MVPRGGWSHPGSATRSDPREQITRPGKKSRSTGLSKPPLPVGPVTNLFCIITKMSFLLSAPAVAMTEHCDTFSDQLRELVRHIPNETPVESNDPVEIRAQKFYQAKLFKSIERQILEYADEIEPKIYARLNPFKEEPSNSKTLTITVQTPSFEEMRDWILREGQFTPCGTELLQCLMLMTPPAKAEPAPPVGEEENK